MPKVVARTYVNVRLLTTESGPGTVLTRTTAWPDGKNMLEILRNGGGKSTLTAIEIFSLVPKPGNRRSRMRDLFRAGTGPSYVAWNLKRTGKNWAPGYEHVYLICAFEQQAGEDQGGEVRRSWAFIPAAHSVEFSKLPLTTTENGRLYPISVDEFAKWANSVQEGEFLRDQSLARVEEAFRKHGLSPKELGTQLLINYDEGGIENFFSKGTTSETCFENCLMPVVSDSVWGDRDENWLVDAILALADTARDQRKEISKLELSRHYTDKLKAAKGAFETDHARRQELSELWCRATRLAKLTEERMAELDDLTADAQGQLQDLGVQEHLVEHIDLSVRYYGRLESWRTNDSLAKRLQAERDGLEGELEKVGMDLALDEAARAYNAWKPQSDTVLALEHAISVLEKQGGQMGAEAEQLQAMAMAAWKDELARAHKDCEDAQQKLAEAERAQYQAEEEHAINDACRFDTSSAVGAARKDLDHAYDDLMKAGECEPPVEACTQILSSPNLMGYYDQDRTENCMADAAKAEASADKAHVLAQEREEEARAAVSILSAELDEAKFREADARTQKDDVAQRATAAQDALVALESYLRQASSNPTEAQDVETLQGIIRATDAELCAQRTEAQSKRQELHAQIEAFEQHGSARIDSAILAILDELNIRFRTIRHVAEEDGIDLETYLHDAPWLADLIFMGEEDALLLSKTLAKRTGANKLVAFVCTTDDLDAILAGQPAHIHMCTNAAVDLVISPEKWRRALDERLDGIAHELKSLEFRERAISQASDALTDYRVALRSCSSLSSLQELLEATLRSWEEARQHLVATQRQVEDAQQKLEVLVSRREQAQSDALLAQDVRRKWAAVFAAMHAYHVAKDALSQAEEKLEAATERYAASSRRVEAARKLRAEARDKLARHTTHHGEIRSHKDAVWSDALSPMADPQGRDAQTLTAAWNQARDELEKKSEDLGKRLQDRRGELKLHKELAAKHLEPLQAACERANITPEDAASQVAFISEAHTVELKGAKSKLEHDLSQARQEAGKAEKARDKAGTLLEAATDELKRRGFEQALPQEECRNLNVEEERSRIRSQRRELGSLLEDMRQENSLMSMAKNSALQMSRQLREAGAYEQYDPLSTPSADKSGALDECDSLEHGYAQAIDRRTQSKADAIGLIEALVDLPATDETIHESAQDNRHALLKALEDATEYESNAMSRELDDAIEACESRIGLLESQLEEYESRLRQAAKHSASDVADALSRLNRIVHDSAIDVSGPEEPTRRVEFLELSLGGRSVHSIYTSKARTDLVDDIEVQLLPYLRTLTEDVLAPISDKSAAQAKASRELTLSRLLRIYVGGGSPCGVSVKHATYTKHEVRRHKDWSTLFNRGALAQSGAETTLVFFAVYLAITACVRETEMPAGVDNQRFVILDNPFTKMSDKWAVEFLGRMAEHFGCQMIVKTALQEIASHNVFPRICSYREAKMSADGTIILQLETSEGEPRTLDVLATSSEQMTLGL